MKFLRSLKAEKLVEQLIAVRHHDESQDVSAISGKIIGLGPAAVPHVIDALGNAGNPVIYAGGGVLLARASQELQQLAEHFDIPIAHSIMGKGVLVMLMGTIGIVVGGVHGVEAQRVLPFPAHAELERVIFVMKGGEVVRWDGVSYK